MSSSTPQKTPAEILADARARGLPPPPPPGQQVAAAAAAAAAGNFPNVGPPGRRNDLAARRDAGLPPPPPPGRNNDVPDSGTIRPPNEMAAQYYELPNPPTQGGQSSSSSSGSTNP